MKRDKNIDINIKRCQITFQLDEAKSIMPPGENEDWHRWDGTTYHGWSILAVNNLNKVNTLEKKLEFKDFFLAKNQLKNYVPPSGEISDGEIPILTCLVQQGKMKPTSKF